MQKNLPKYTPEWVHARRGVGRGVAPRGHVRAVQRPADAAVVRQPAGRRVPPGADAGRRPPPHPPDHGSRPARGRRLRRWSSRRRGWSGRRWPTSAWPARSRPAAPRACTSSSRSTGDVRAEDVAAATRAVAARAERLDPELATTAFIREDRHGKVFLDSTRAGGATVVAAYSPRIRPGVPVSFPVAWDDLDDVTPADFTIHTAPRPARRRRPVGGGDARAAGARPGAGRGGAHHPGRPGAGDARGQAPRPGQARLRG